MTCQAVHAAAAPLISEKGVKFYDKFIEAMMRIIRPVAQLSFFDRFTQIAREQDEGCQEKKAS